MCAVLIFIKVFKKKKLVNLYIMILIAICGEKENYYYGYIFLEFVREKG